MYTPMFFPGALTYMYSLHACTYISVHTTRAQYQATAASEVPGSKHEKKRIPELDSRTRSRNGAKQQTNKQNPGTRVSDVDAFEDPNMQFSPSPNLNPIPRVIVIFTTQLGFYFCFIGSWN